MVGQDSQLRGAPKPNSVPFIRFCISKIVGAPQPVGPGGPLRLHPALAITNPIVKNNYESSEKKCVIFMLTTRAVKL